MSPHGSLPAALVGFFLALAASRAAAQPPWSAAEVAARFAEQNADDPAPARSPVFSGLVYGERLVALATFLSHLQERPPLGLHRGGVWTDESRIATDPQRFVQTVDTMQAIWVWSHHRARTGARTFDTELALAWQYVRNHPAWFEEGGGSDFGYYRVYNCAWALFAEPVYRHATGDASHLAYARSCATYLVAFPLRLTGMLNVELHAFAEGLAMAALHRFAVERGDLALAQVAVQRGQDLRRLAERHPAWLGTESWALSGGCLFVGVLEAAFGGDPEGRRVWADRHDDHLKRRDTSGTWHDAHNAWYALAHATAWRTSARLDAHGRHLAILDHLLRRDGDGDGGIPADGTLGDREDASWVTSQLAFGGIEPVEADFDLRLEPEHYALPPGVPLQFELAWTNHLPTAQNTAVFLLATPPGLPPLPLGMHAGSLAPRSAFTAGRLAFPLVPGTHSGTWRIDAYLFGRNATLRVVRGFVVVVP